MTTWNPVSGGEGGCAFGDASLGTAFPIKLDLGKQHAGCRERDLIAESVEIFIFIESVEIFILPSPIVERGS